MLLWTFRYKFLFEHMFSVLWGIYLRVELLGHWATSWIIALSWQRALCNSVRPRAMQCRATQDWQVIVERSDKIWSTGRGNGKPLQYLVVRIPWIVWKGKKMWHQKMSPPSKKVSSILLGKNGGQLQRAPERMKHMGQSRNDAQLWMCLMMKVKSDAVKNNTA